MDNLNTIISAIFFSFIHIDKQPIPRGERGGPNVLVLSPTRELALQIAEEVKKYEYHGIKSVCVYGGGDRRQQKKIVTDGVEIIIATPGMNFSRHFVFRRVLMRFVLLNGYQDA